MKSIQQIQYKVFQITLKPINFITFSVMIVVLVIYTGFVILTSLPLIAAIIVPLPLLISILFFKIISVSSKIVIDFNTNLFYEIQFGKKVNIQSLVPFTQVVRSFVSRSSHVVYNKWQPKNSGWMQYDLINDTGLVCSLFTQVSIEQDKEEFYPFLTQHFTVVEGSPSTRISSH